MGTARISNCFRCYSPWAQPKSEDFRGGGQAPGCFSLHITAISASAVLFRTSAERLSLAVSGVQTSGGCITLSRSVSAGRGGEVARERRLEAREVEEIFTAFAEAMRELPPDVEAG